MSFLFDAVGIVKSNFGVSLISAVDTSTSHPCFYQPQLTRSTIGMHFFQLFS